MVGSGLGAGGPVRIVIELGSDVIERCDLDEVWSLMVAVWMSVWFREELEMREERSVGEDEKRTKPTLLVFRRGLGLLALLDGGESAHFRGGVEKLMKLDWT